MATWIILSVLASFGALSAAWALFGGLLPGGKGGAAVVLCRAGDRPEATLRRYRWLRDLGLIRYPLLIVDGGMEPKERARLERDTEICSLEELPARLEQERKKLD